MVESSVENPVAYIWYWLSCDDGADKPVMNWTLPRAEVIKALSSIRIAAGTISVQRHKFLKATVVERQARAAKAVVVQS